MDLVRLFANPVKALVEARTEGANLSPICIARSLNAPVICNVLSLVVSCSSPRLATNLSAASNAALVKAVFLSWSVN